LTVDKKLLHQN